MSGVLVIDVGTSGVRSAVVRPDGSIGPSHHEVVLPSSPEPSLVEFDARRLADAALTVANAALAENGGAGSVDAVGIANQRASTVVWDPATGEPVGPGIGWQDLRTVINCLMLQAEGIRVAPNASATKLGWLLDTFDPDRSRDLLFGTVDTWIAWNLSRGEIHVTDATNAGVTGLVVKGGDAWDPKALAVLRVPEAMMPTIVDSVGAVGLASALPGAPPIAGIAGDQQASLVGQGCTRPGLAKITFGTGAMLDQVTGQERPGFHARGNGGCFPIVAWRRHGIPTWGVEAIMLTAGSCIEWLRDDLGILGSAAESESVAAACETTGGVWFVPALQGLGTPHWDFGARGTLLGLTRGTGRAEVTRAVLEGIAHRGADLVESAEQDSGLCIPALRVDGGMTANAVFVQALADAAARPVEVSPVLEATTLGAGYLAGMAVGIWKDEDDVAAAWSPSRVVEPSGATPDRTRWREAVERAKRWEAGLSDVDFA